VIIAGSTVLVTGASSGIGAAIADRLTAAGARVLAHGRDAARLAEIDGARAIVADLAEPDQVRRLAAEAGDIEILVANAGIGYTGDFTAMTDSDIGRLLQVNLAAPIQLTHALLPALVRHEHAAIVYVTSIAGRMGVRGEAVYAATKAGLDAFAESLRFELPRHVSVGVLVPGVVDTPFFLRRGRPYDRVRPKPVPAAVLADACIRLIRSGAAEVYRPNWLRAPVAIRGLAPRTYRTLAGRFGGS
jgi:short-subunit dehydrogenase